MNAPRIAVTGVGIVSALGLDAKTTFSRLLLGERGVGPVSLFDVTGQRATLAAEVKGFRTSDVAPASELSAWSRSDALAVTAAREALESAGLLQRASDLSVAVGGTTGGMFEAEAVLGALQQGAVPEASIRRLLAYPLSTTADRIAQVFGARRALTVCSACSSSAVALVQGAAWIEQGEAEVVLAGGTDGLCSLTFTGFNALGAMDPAPCRPFDRERAGLNLGEGAAFLVLEREDRARARGAHIYALLSGWAVLAEAHHITHPEPSGATAAQLLERAMARAGFSPADVDYVNAHGTGTPPNDSMEARALGLAFGPHADRVRVSSSKAQVGHTLGAAGAVEAAFTVLALDQQRVPPTVGLERPEPEFPLRHVFAAEPAELRAALSSSFGFGGTGSVLAFERNRAERVRSRPQPASTTLVITGAAAIGPLGVRTGDDAAEYASAELAPSLTLPFDPVQQLDPARSRRFDRSTALITLCAERALADAGLRGDQAGLVAGTAFGNVERCVEFLSRVSARGARLAHPAEFPHLVPSSAAGNASIYLHVRGPVVTVSDLATSAEAAVVHAAALVSAGTADAVVAGSAEAADAIVTRVLGPLCGIREPAPRSEGAGFVVIERALSARARGRRPMAVLRRILHGVEAPALLLARCDLPANPERAAIFTSFDDPEFERAFAASGWRQATRASVIARSGWHEATGGIALACCSALIARKVYDEALVIGAAQGRAHVLHLVQAESAGWDEAS